MKPRKPLVRKRAKPRTFKTPRCIWRGCRRPQQHIQRCRTHAHRHLDTLWSRAVRTGACDVPHLALWGFPCGGAIQANHGYDRGDYGTRWELRNGFSACAAMNTWAYRTGRRRWYAWVEAQWGPTLTARMRALADAPAKIDYEAVLASLMP